MGRTNKQWSHVIGIGVEVSAPDVNEASRRIEDVRDALQARFTGSEIYPPRIAGSPSRIPGSPTFKHFILMDRPTEVDPFSDALAVTETVMKQGSTPDRNVKIQQAAESLVGLIRQSIEAGWIPDRGNIADAVEVLESVLGSE